MSLGGRAWDVLSKRDNLIHIFLGCSFVALCIRSVGQQNDIESLQAEKEQLQKTNKAMKKAIWDWKQQLFQEASQDATAYPVPLSRLKAIYGDTVSQQGTHSDEMPFLVLSHVFFEFAFNLISMQATLSFVLLGIRFVVSYVVLLLAVSCSFLYLLE